MFEDGSDEAEQTAPESTSDDWQYNRWFGEPLRPGDTVSHRINTYIPASIAPEAWLRIGPLVRQITTESAPKTPYTAERVLSTLAQLTAWCERVGLPMQARVILHPSTIDRWIAVAKSSLTDGSQLNYRSLLRRVGEQVVGPPEYPPRALPMRLSDPTSPYLSTELAGLLGWARGLPSERLRTYALVLIAFFRGAGLKRRDLNVLFGTDVTRDEDGVVIHVGGTTPRLVPVLRRWEEHVWEAAIRSGDQLVFLPNRQNVTRDDVTNFLENCPETTAGVPRLSPTRLRVTWIVHHLAAGTPLPILAIAAGASEKQLAGYLRFVPPIDPSEARRLLRDAGSA